MGIRACVHSTYARLSGWKRPKTCCTQSNVRMQVAWWVRVKNAQILRTYYIHCTRSLTVLLHCRNIFLHPISSQVDLSTIIHLRFFAILWEMLMKRTLRENPFFKDMENMRPTNIQDEAVSSHSVDCSKRHTEFKGFEIALVTFFLFCTLPTNLNKSRSHKSAKKSVKPCRCMKICSCSCCHALRKVGWPDTIPFNSIEDTLPGVSF